MRIDVWTKKVRELFYELPENYWLYAADNRLHVMRYKRNGKRRLDGDGMSQKSIYKTISTTTEIDGGDW